MSATVVITAVEMSRRGQLSVTINKSTSIGCSTLTIHASRSNGYPQKQSSERHWIFPDLKQPQQTAIDICFVIPRQRSIGGIKNDVNLVAA